MRSGYAVLLAALLAGGCATVRPVPPSEAERVRAAWDHARRAAFGPRRFKAMWKGDVSPTVGMVSHGFLLVWWDGTALTWKASAPLAGNVKGGRLAAGAPGGAAPFPGRLLPADAIGVLLGALDLPAGGRPVERAGSRYRLFLDGYGRAASLDDDLRVLGLDLPEGTHVTYEPGEGLPHRIDASSRDGHAHLSLESLGPWPEGEPIPGE